MDNKQPIIINNPNPWFDAILTGKKTVEGRLNKGKYRLLKPGQVIRFFDSSTQRIMQVSIKAIRQYPSFQAYIQSEGLLKVAPHLHSIRDAVKTYQQFYREKDPDLKYGVLAIEVDNPGLI